ncbi:hypothetical protein [Polaribacter dokdonensis]|uniref:Uncharacterized protein n=1 Tax=Polaribacter dokdonensis DSW-5 TaxID=1300348 RepID=A0A0N0UNJ1_9FLAO|nr:hypothetical protein [Polaribacter dokdonensis]KOY51774.1 hypothetical protein I602_1334 [Polaribacter dokdonensis DSW-5]SEE03395.1 hypothetical protein SAMN05444353_0436 [Polaribacter dokdonensis DSW-5]
MKRKSVFIIPVIKEDPGVFSSVFKTFKNIYFCDVLFVVSPKNKCKETFKELIGSYKNLHLLITEKNYNRAVLFKKGLYHFNTFLNNNDDGYKYVISIRKFDNSYLDVILDGMMEIQKSNFDVLYCLVENEKLPLRLSNVNKGIKKSVLDTFRSQSFIATANFVNNIYANPFNKIITFYYLLRNAKFKPKYTY